MTYDLKNIKVIGYTTDFNQCECCGKSDLKGTVSILDKNTDVVLHFGTTCALKADKFDSLQAYETARKEIKAEISHFKDLEKSAIKFAWNHLKAIYGISVINGDTLQLKCGQDIYNDCIKSAFQYLSQPWDKRGIFKLKKI